VAKPNGNPTLLTRVVKGLGYVLGPETPTGKAFTFVEKAGTKLFDRLGKNEFYLDLVGRTLNRSLRAQKLYVKNQETMLRRLRLPTTTEVDELREQVRELSDQMEAIGSQLEVVLDSLEGRRQQKQRPEAKNASNANGSA
jgi:hypothetical protein